MCLFYIVVSGHTWFDCHLQHIAYSPILLTCTLALRYHPTGSCACIHLHFTLLHGCVIATDIICSCIAPHVAQDRGGVVAFLPVIGACVAHFFAALQLWCWQPVLRCCYDPISIIAQCQLYVSLGTPPQHMGLLHYIFTYRHTFL